MNEYEVSIRCSCGFWREYVVKRLDDAEKIRDELANEHARCGTRSIQIDPVELVDGRHRRIA